MMSTPKLDLSYAPPKVRAPDRDTGNSVFRIHF